MGDEPHFMRKTSSPPRGLTAGSTRSLILPIAMAHPHLNLSRRVLPGRASGQKPNCKFNLDANSGHAFGILLAAVGALRPSGSGAS